MPSCSFRKCTNNSRNTNKASGITFHSFPRDSHYKEKWIKIIQQDQRDEEWLPTKFSRICSAHFNVNDCYFTSRGLRKIKARALPSFLPSFPTVESVEPAASDEPAKPAETAEPGETMEPLEEHLIPVIDVYVSDNESIFDSPGKTSLKKQLRLEKSKKQKYRVQVIKLKRQNKRLQSKVTFLKNLVKTLKEEKLAGTKC